jgi:hypothetical protein
MEKQTKILLGVGAVIAAYLILKPKKVLAQTEEAQTNLPKSPYMPEVIIQQDKAIELQILSLLQRRREQEERRNYLIAEANRPDNVGSPAYMSPDELKIIQESYLSSRQLINPWS